MYIDRQDDDQGEEKGDCEELDGHLEERQKLYGESTSWLRAKTEARITHHEGIEASRSKDLLFRYLVKNRDPPKEGIGQRRERGSSIRLPLASGVEACPSWP